MANKKKKTNERRTFRVNFPQGYCPPEKHMKKTLIALAVAAVLVSGSFALVAHKNVNQILREGNGNPPPCPPCK